MGEGDTVTYKTYFVEGFFMIRSDDSHLKRGSSLTYSGIPFSGQKMPIPRTGRRGREARRSEGKLALRCEVTLGSERPDDWDLFHRPRPSSVCAELRTC